jgi:hypothetical protein
VADSDQQLHEAANVALINVTPRGDDRVHLVEFLRVTSGSTTTSWDLLLRFRDVRSSDITAERSITNNTNLSVAMR